MKKFMVLLFLAMFTFLAAEWTILETYNIPGKASGLAWDGEHLYSGIYGANGSNIYQIDPSDGSYQLLFSDPVLDDTYGLTFDGEYLWLTDHRNGSAQPATAYQYDFQGNILDQFDLPDHYMSGIAYDQGNFWVATYYPDGPSVIYQVNNSGEILQQIDFVLPSDSEQPWDLCLENGALWVADYYDNSLYKLDTTDGSILESHASENLKPSGVVFDGTYLWYVDGELSSDAVLYKVDLGGAGTPIIATNWQQYDFDFVNVGSIAEVDLQITNNGNADLVISDLQFSDQQYSSEESLPLTILAGATANITLSFAPDSFGAFPSELEIFSNDPINPQLTLNLHAYGLMENPTLVVEPVSNDFGTIRSGSSRSQLFNLSNQGSNNLVIGGIGLDSEQFYLDDVLSFDTEIVLESADTLQARIWFYPEDSGNYQAEATIFCNDPENMTYVLELEGTAAAEDFVLGQLVWEYQITDSSDNSIKAIKQIEDITGDNHNDLIVTSEDNYLRAFNGNSDNYADMLWELEIPSGNIFDQKSLAIVEDIDDDNYQDIIVGTGGSDRAVRAISGKTGWMLFVYHTDAYGNGGVVYQVDASKDFTDDGVMDVLAASGNDLDGTGPQRIFLFDGSDGTLLWDYFAAGPKFSVLAIEDVNGDGIPDAIGAGSDLGESFGKVYGIDGSTGSQLWQFTASGSSVWALQQVGDINSDGIEEIIVGDFSGNVYALDAVDGSQIWDINIGDCLILDFEMMDDVNGNGQPDFVVAHSTISNVQLFDGLDGEIIWSNWVSDQPWNIESIADMNGDDVDELIVGTLFQNNNGYFMDGAMGEILGSVNAGSPVDALSGIEDITQDETWEMVLGGRDGMLRCYAAGQQLVSAPESEIVESQANLLLGNYPNPFTPAQAGRSTSTSIAFDLPQAADIKLQIYNSKGQLVKTLLDSQMAAGEHQLSWNGLDAENKPVSSGVYFYRLQSEEHDESRKMLLLK